MIFMKILLIVLVVTIIISTISYEREKTRYINYLERKLENFNFKKIEDAQNKQGLL